MIVFKRNKYSYTTRNYVLGHVLYSLGENCYVPELWYQRQQCWKKKEKQEFLKSLLNDEEVGTFIYYEREITIETGHQYIEIIDGNNRINCLKEFFENKLPYIIDGKKYYFKDMLEIDKSFFLNKTISVKIFSDTHTKKLTEQDKVQIYINFNKKGIPQSKKHIEELEKFLKGKK